MKADRPLPDCVWCPQDRKVLSGLNPLRLLSPPPSSLQLWQCWGSLSHAPGGWECCHGCREFVVLCDIQVHRIIAKHHLFIESFPSPLVLLCNIHCMDISSIMTVWERCTSGVFRTLMAPLYIFWLCPQLGAIQPILCDSEQCWFISTVSFCIYYKITTQRNSGLSVYTLE